MLEKEKIFNDLISNLGDEFIETSKKDKFLNNLDYVKKLLFSGLSTKKQIEIYSKDIDSISRSLYEKYCKEYLKEEYEQGLLNTLFYRNIKTVAYFLTQNEKPNPKELYNLLLENGSLKQARNKKNSSITYEIFVQLLKNFLKQKGYDDLINFNEYNNETKEKSLDECKDENPKIKIEFYDNSFEYYEKSFLIKNFIEQENSYIDNNIKEKNCYYLQTRYIDKEYSFEVFKNIITSKNIIENYSIIIHNNSTVDNRLYIYRLIDEKLVLIKNLNASTSVFELDELIRRSQKNFFDFFDEYLSDIVVN